VQGRREKLGEDYGYLKKVRWWVKKLRKIEIKSLKKGSDK